MAGKTYRRVYLDTILKYKKQIGAVGGISVLFLFAYLVSVGDINIVGYSGNQICAGTVEDPCYAYINFTMNKDYIYIYPNENWTFNTDKPMERIDFQVRDNRVKGGWRTIDLSRPCAALSANTKCDYSYSYRFYKTKGLWEIRLVGYKNNPYETIKWGFGNVDPYWYGLSSSGGTDENKSSNYFTRLVENVVDVDGGYAIFDVTNPDSEKDLDLFKDKIDKAKSKVDVTFFKASGNDIIDWDLYVLDDVVQSIILTNTTKVCEEKFTVNGTQEICENKNVDWLYNYTTKEYVKFADLVLKPGETRRFKLVAKWKLNLGEQKIEWVPKINVDGVDVENKEWAWWNATSFNYKRSLTCGLKGNRTEYAASDEGVEMWLNDSTITNCTTNIRYINAAESAQVPFDVLADSISASGQCHLRFMMNATTDGAVCGYMYYDPLVLDITTATGGLAYPSTANFIIKNSKVQWTFQGSGKGLGSIKRLDGGNTELCSNSICLGLTATSNCIGTWACEGGTLTNSTKCLDGRECTIAKDVSFRSSGGTSRMNYTVWDSDYAWLNINSTTVFTIFGTTSPTYFNADPVLTYRTAANQTVNWWNDGGNHVMNFSGWFIQRKANVANSDNLGLIWQPNETTANVFGSSGTQNAMAYTTGQYWGYFFYNSTYQGLPKTAPELKTSVNCPDCWTMKTLYYVGKEGGDDRAVIANASIRWLKFLNPVELTLGAEQGGAVVYYNYTSINISLNTTVNADKIVSYGEPVNMTGIANRSVSITIMKNGTSLNAGYANYTLWSNNTLFAGNTRYNITAWFKGNATHNESWNNKTLSVVRANTSVVLTFDRTNMTYTDGNLGIECRANTTTGAVMQLYRNTTKVNDTSTAYNYIIYNDSIGGGWWNYTCYSLANNNYTYSYSMNNNFKVTPAYPIWNESSGYLGSTKSIVKNNIENNVLFSYLKAKNESLDYAWLATNETGTWENYTAILNTTIANFGFEFNYSVEPPLNSWNATNWTQMDYAPYIMSRCDNIILTGASANGSWYYTSLWNCTPGSIAQEQEAQVNSSIFTIYEPYICYYSKGFDMENSKHVWTDIDVGMDKILDVRQEMPNIASWSYHCLNVSNYYGQEAIIILNDSAGGANNGFGCWDTFCQATGNTSDNECRYSINNSIYLNTTNTWTWANFTWFNTSSSLEGKTISWKTYFNNSLGYENVTDVSNFTIFKRIPTNISLTFDRYVSQNYTSGINLGIECRMNMAEPTTIKIFRNNTQIYSNSSTLFAIYNDSLPAGWWNISCNSTQTMNYTTASNFSYFLINLATPNLHLALNGTEGNKSYYFESINATAWYNASQFGNVSIWRNNTMINSSTTSKSIFNISNNLTITKWNYTAYFYGTQNYTSQTVTYWATQWNISLLVEQPSFKRYAIEDMFADSSEPNTTHGTSYYDLLSGGIAPNGLSAAYPRYGWFKFPIKYNSTSSTITYPSFRAYWNNTDIDGSSIWNNVTAGVKLNDTEKAKLYYLDDSSASGIDDPPYKTLRSTWILEGNVIVNNFYIQTSSYVDAPSEVGTFLFIYNFTNSSYMKVNSTLVLITPTRLNYYAVGTTGFYQSNGTHTLIHTAISSGGQNDKYFYVDWINMTISIISNTTVNETKIPYFDKASLYIYQMPTNGTPYIECNSTYPCVTELFYSLNQTWKSKNISWSDQPTYDNYVIDRKNFTSDSGWRTWDITNHLASILANSTFMLRIPSIKIDMKYMNLSRSNNTCATCWVNQSPYVYGEVTKYLINYTGNASTGTFQPKGQTETQWFFNITNIGEISDIYARWNVTLPSCMMHWMSLNKTLETNFDYNITNSSWSKIIDNLAIGGNRTFWTFFVFNNCSAGATTNSSLAFNITEG